MNKQSDSTAAEQCFKSNKMTNEKLKYEFKGEGLVAIKYQNEVFGTWDNMKCSDCPEDLIIGRDLNELLEIGVSIGLAMAKQDRAMTEFAALESAKEAQGFDQWQRDNNWKRDIIGFCNPDNGWWSVPFESVYQLYKEGKG